MYNIRESEIEISSKPDGYRATKPEGEYSLPSTLSLGDFWKDLGATVLPNTYFMYIQIYIYSGDIHANGTLIKMYM